MNDNITHVDFTKPALTPDPEIIGKLEYILSLAKEGHVVSMALSAISNEGSSYTTFTTGMETHALIGSVSYLHHRMLIHLDNATPGQMMTPKPSVPIADENDTAKIHVGIFGGHNHELQERCEEDSQAGENPTEER